MLSNTATPKYYAQFREQVLAGNLPICLEIEQEMNRIDWRIRNPQIYYDPIPVEGWIKFCENELTLVDGTDMELLPSFKLWGEQLYGWYYFIEREVFVPSFRGSGGHYEKKLVKRRLINKQYIITARGSAKTMYASAIHAYECSVSSETTTQAAVAPTIRQAEETLIPIKTALVRARGPLFKFFRSGSLNNTTGSPVNRIKMAGTKRGIENFITNSIIETRPMSIDKLQGSRAKICTLDEWLSCDVREDVITALEQSASKTPDYMVIGISSEGTIRNSVGDALKMELYSTLKGEFVDLHTSIFFYKLDSIDEVSHPEMWVKASPNIGKTVSYEAYQNDLERAEKNPSTRNEILAKRFGIPLEGYTYFFPYEETIPHSHKDFWSMPCALGVDLSRGDDFCAFTFLFPLGDDVFGVKTRCYISSKTQDELSKPLRDKYREFIQEGSLVVMDGIVLRMEDVYIDLEAHIEEKQYDVRAMGYDPYNAKKFLESWTIDHGPYGIEKVIQGARTESVPLGELKKLSEARKLLFDESLMSFCMGNCVALVDTNDNRKLYKKRRDQKIDAVAAMMDGYIAWKLFIDNFE